MTRQPIPDPHGDLRAAMVARLEYGVSSWDGRASVEYREPRPVCCRCHKPIGVRSTPVQTDAGPRHESDCVSQDAHLEAMGL